MNEYHLHLDRLESFVAEKFPHLTEGTITAMLRLCLKNDGLIYPPVEKPDFLFAFYRYYPESRRAVEEQDFDELNRRDLTYGPLLYVSAFVAPIKGYEIFRECVDVLNPMALTFHRMDRRSGKWRFGFLQNRRFRKPREAYHG
jgi:hypothetical protein